MQDGKHCLHFALQKGNAEVALTLIKKSPSVVTLVDKGGTPPLHMCTSLEQVQMLLEHGARVDQQTKVI